MKAIHTIQRLAKLENNAFILEVYDEIFNRKPDPLETQRVANQLRAGAGKAAIITELLVNYLNTDKQSVPRDYRLITSEWMSSYFANTDINNKFIYTFDDKSYYNFDSPQPKGVSVNFAWDFPTYPWVDPITRTKPSPQFVAVLPAGRVWGANGTVITPDHKLLWDVSVDYVANYSKHPVFSAGSLPPVVRIAGTIAVLAFTASKNPYHWMFDVIPRIQFIRQSGIKVDKYVLDVSQLLPYQEEMLSVLGISRQQIIACSAQTHIEADRLVAASLAGCNGYPPRSTCTFIRKQFLSRFSSPSAEFKRIYISRGDAPSRRIANEAEMMKLLDTHGFKKILLEKLSLAERIRIFSSAEAVISPHGAGLANLVFCKPGTKVIEVFNPSYAFPCYWNISKNCGLDYYYLLGERRMRSPHSWPGGEDINIKMSALDQTLKLASIH